MDSASRNKFIRDIITRVKAEEQKAEELKQQQAANNNQQGNTGMFNPQIGSQGTGQWYFYNNLLKAQGLNDFIKRWGAGRKNEDNWRRSNKAQTFDNISDGTPEKKDTARGKDSVALKSNDVHQPEYYLKTLPFTKADRDSSNKRILEAFYSLGSIYREQLNNTRKSAETFEEMNRRFPKNRYEAASYYQMYLIYLAQKNNDKAQRAKDYILTNYPNSDYARIINDPNFASSASAQKNAIENYYTETYELFAQKNYNEAFNKSKDALVRFATNDYTARFAYLTALSAGYLFGIDSLEKGLIQVTARYTKSEVYEPARAMLNAVKKQKKTFSAADTLSNPNNLPPTVYAYNETSPHYCLIVLYQTKQVNMMKEAISDFNAQYYSNSKFETVALPKGDKVFVNIRTFKNKDEAMDYYNFINSKQTEVFGGIDKKDYQVFVITPENVTVLLSRQDVEEYKTFFNAKYIGIKQ
jgi:hypothetical protein